MPCAGARPAQRAVEPGDALAAARARARDCLAAVADAAGAARVVYCIEPLARRATPLVNTVAEAPPPGPRGGPAASEPEPVTATLDRWLPTGLIAHVQLNDRNRRGPGQGDDRFA